MEHTPYIRRHLEDARRALAPVAALLQELAIDADRAAEDPTPETQAALAADLHRMLAALREPTRCSPSATGWNPVQILNDCTTPRGIENLCTAATRPPLAPTTPASAL